MFPRKVIEKADVHLFYPVHFFPVGVLDNCTEWTAHANVIVLCLHFPVPVAGFFFWGGAFVVRQTNIKEHIDCSRKHLVGPFVC